MILKKISNLYLPNLFFIFTLILSYLIGLLFYNVTDGLDWQTYYKYIDYFLYGNNEITENQGLIYYFIISSTIKSQLSLIGPYNILEVFNNGIQLGNFLLYCLGLFGLFKLFISEGFSKKNIMYTLSILNFFPSVIFLRLTMKPEILAFALLPWFLYCSKKYLQSKSFVYLISACFSLSILLTSKASIAAMITLVFIAVFKNDSIMFLKDKKFILLFILIFLLLSYENYLITDKTILQKEVLEQYENRASFKFLYYINLPLLITDPYKFLHSNSLVSIILLDTFGDYFDFFWNNDESYFVMDTVKYTNNFFISSYLRKYIGIFLTIIFYLLNLFFLKKNIKKAYLYFPFIGIFTLLLSSFGIPSNNFDPLAADTLKVHYYAFLLAITFSYLILKIFDRTKYNLIYSQILILSFVFLFGFPKTFSVNLENQLLHKFYLSEVCSVSLIEKTDEANCKNQSSITCTEDPFTYEYDQEVVVKTDHRVATTLYYLPIQLSKNDIEVSARSRLECVNYFNNGYRYLSKYKILNDPRTPFINVLSFLLFCISAIFTNRKETLN